MAPTTASLIALGCLSISVSAARFRGLQAQTVSPVAKVITLLKNLQKQVEEEGQKEAAEYDKFSCWCKETADNTLYNIETSDKKIKRWQANVDVLTAEIDQANENIAAFSKEISRLDTKIGEETTTNEAAIARFVERVSTMKNGLESIEGAIKALRSSKEAMSSDVKLNLEQVKSRTGRAFSLLQSTLNADQNPPSFTYHSSAIIGTLEGLRSTFTDRIRAFEEDEHRRRSAAEMSISADERSSKIAADQKADEESVFAAKTEEKTKKEDSIKEEKKMKEDDDNFLTEVTKECQDRAADWDARSQERAGELKAIAQAVHQLQTVSKNWGANKRLAGIQRSAKRKSVPTFLELGTDRHSLKTVLNHLDSAAHKLDSPVLAALAAKVALQKDHFVKVRGLIKDLIKRLEEDALAEKAKKDDCDEKITKQTASRDENNEILERQTSKETKAKNEVVEAEEAITAGKALVAEKTKEIADATALRTQSNEENTLTVQEAEEGLAACEQAREILNDFYKGSSSFLQSSVSYVPPNANRDGVNVEDARPDIFEGGDVKNKDAGTNIIALLDVIISDFKRTIDATQETEQTEETDFQTLKTDTEKEISDTNDEIIKQESNKATAESDEMDANTAKKDAKDAVDLSNDKLDDLKVGCIDEKVDYAERVKRRQQEIQALKDAMSILESMGPSM